MLVEEFLRWRCIWKGVCEAANTDLSNVFQICSSSAFGLGSPLVSPISFWPQPIAGKMALHLERRM